jgi:hypothetical protein
VRDLCHAGAPPALIQPVFDERPRHFLEIACISCQESRIMRQADRGNLQVLRAGQRENSAELEKSSGCLFVDGEHSETSAFLIRLFTPCGTRAAWPQQSECHFWQRPRFSASHRRVWCGPSFPVSELEVGDPVSSVPGLSCSYLKNAIPAGAR